MKKFLAILLCLVAGLSAVGCMPIPDDEPSDITENNGITADEALEIAKEYWKNHDIEKNGYIIAEAVNKNAPDTVYVFVLKHLVEIEGHSHYSTIDEVWVDKLTGEATPPYPRME